ncbi:MAG: L,D-transpeptidase [Saprospiraceae bacterium]|nr:L,D-transpeptidase [Saprospiraceae bacterium]
MAVGIYFILFFCLGHDLIAEDSLPQISVNQPIKMGEYFDVMDDFIDRYNEIQNTPIDEYIFVHCNPWIIDSLAATDYYIMKEKGNTVLDNRNLIILNRGDKLNLPDSAEIIKIKLKLDSIWLDVNIPEYKLRIRKGDEVLYTFPIRIGQNKERYLATAKRIVSLKTDLGVGKISKSIREPYFLNPVNGRHFTTTKRDDGIVTEMPLIPWLETEINGVKNGDMIHPTTNLKTLNKAYSNGCIGLRESDAWYVYYYAPVGTKVVIRYDLNLKNEYGEEIILKDVYKLR